MDAVKYSTSVSLDSIKIPILSAEYPYFDSPSSLFAGAVVHGKRPHLDEVVAMAIVWMHSTSYFARLYGQELNNGKLGVVIGTGGGAFDEHSDGDGCVVPNGLCAAVLVAREMGFQDGAWKPILEYTTERDRKPVAVCETGLGNIVKAAGLGDDPETIYNWAIGACQLMYLVSLRENKLSRQDEDDIIAGIEQAMNCNVPHGTFGAPRDLLSLRNIALAHVAIYGNVVATADWLLPAVEVLISRNAHRKKAKKMVASMMGKRSKGSFYGLYYVETGRKYLKVLAVEGDNQFISSAARQAGCDVVVQWSSAGNIAVFVDYRLKLDLAPIVRRVRRLELWARERREDSKRLTDRELEAAGDVEEIPEWYYFLTEDGNGTLLNGSFHHSRDPSSIPKGAFALAVFEGLKETKYRQYQHQSQRRPKSRGRSRQQTVSA